MHHAILQAWLLTSILGGIVSVSPANEIPAFIPSHSLQQFLLEPIQLRWSPQELSEVQARRMIEAYGFYERKLHPYSDLPNIYLPMSVHGQVFVTDMQHDLLWATGLDLYASFESAAESLADVCYAGYNDWRLPTLEELASLLEAPNGGKRYYNLAFSDAPLEIALTSDMTEDGKLAWSVRFDRGIVTTVERHAFWKVLPVRTGSKLPIRSKCRASL